MAMTLKCSKEEIIPIKYIDSSLEKTPENNIIYSWLNKLQPKFRKNIVKYYYLGV